ncbi:MAG: DUF523 domain-containing protein [Firmicutes bacterium]|nr:DUF523 domain-containing protein [Bacillota bacterium]
MYIVSACLAGVSCRYDGKDNLIEEIEELVKVGKAILVCPEQLGGLTTPRNPAEIIKCKDGSSRVLNNKGQDVTKSFLKGAQETLRIAEIAGVNTAILKARSPSCGFGKIYDGSFSGNKVKGNGLAAELLHKKGIKIYSEENLPDELLKSIKSTDKKEE